jgi:PDZ domain-containing secreted protein
MKEKEGEHLIHIDSETKAIVSDEKIGDRSAFLNMLYLKTIDKENKLSSIRTNLREIQMQLIMHRITLGNLEEYKTEMVGVITNTVMELKEEEAVKSNTIAVGGIVGLIMSLFIAFCMESIEESKLKRKRK